MATSYVVKSGDTLSAIAARNGLTVSQLLQYNPSLTTNPKYKNGSVIFSGTTIKLAPPATSTPSASLPALTPSAPTPTAVEPTQPLVMPTVAVPNVSVPTLSPVLPSDILEQNVQTSVPQLMPTVAVPTTSPAAPTPSAAVPSGIADVPFTPLPMSMAPPQMGGYASDQLQYLSDVRTATAGLQGAAALAAQEKRNTLIDTETALRKAQREAYQNQVRAQAGLAARGISGAPGLTVAAKRAAAAAPTEVATSTLLNRQRQLNALDSALARQKLAFEEQQRLANEKLAKITNTANALTGA